MGMAQIVIRLEKPVIQSFLDENNCTVIRQDDDHVYILEPARNRYKGDDETIVFDLGHGLFKNYDGKYSIVWEESDY